MGEGSVVDAILEEIRSRETEAPETDPPAVLTEPETEAVSVTARPETDGAETAPPAVTEAKEPETKQADGRLWLYLGCGIVIAASVTVIVIARRRKQK